MARADAPRSRSGYPPEGRSSAQHNPAGRVPPHSPEAERGLLAACLTDGGRDTMTLCVDRKLTPDCFYKPAHQLMFEGMRALYEEGKSFDEIILSEKLKQLGTLEEAGGLVALTDLTSSIEGTLYAQHYLNLVLDKAMVRRLIRVATETVEDCYAEQDSVDQFIDKVEQSVFQISQDRVSDSARHIEGSVEEVTAQIHQFLQKKTSHYGVRSGYTDLDNMTFGFHKAEMIVLAARPSVGKTSLAMNFAEHVSCPPDDGSEAAATLVFSLEMSAVQLAFRMVTCRGRVDAKRVRQGYLNEPEQRQLANAARELKQAPIYIDDSGNVTILEVRAKARRLHSRRELGLIVIDYLQLIKGTDPRAPRENQIAEISRGIKALAKELNVPVLVLSQLNREAEKEKRDPRLSDLRESGAIEQDADVVFLLARDRGQREEEAEDGGLPATAEKINLIIAKQRNGPVGEVPLTFQRQYTRFENFVAS